MVTKCANPACGKSFHYLRGGKLFLVDLRHSPPPLQRATNSSEAVEYFWLCEKCAAELTIAIDNNGNMKTVRTGTVDVSGAHHLSTL